MAAQRSQRVPRTGSRHRFWSPWVLGAVLILAGGFAHAYEDDATRVVERYFEALQDGDVETIRTLLGARLLARKERLLSNPTYPDYLRAHYQDLSVEITTAAVEPGLIELKVDLQSPQEGSQSLWLSLVRDADSGSYRIEEESEHVSDH